MHPPPRKRFGQHFLIDEGAIAAIVGAIAPHPGQSMVEIGPGRGALTRPLIASLEHLHVVEIDRDLVVRLRQTFSPAQLTVHACDALRFDFGALDSPLRVVGNLPYNISSPLLFHLAGFANAIADMHFMLQLEVVERMVAPPGGAAYGRLSVMLQYRFALEQLFEVSPQAFDPAPQVESAVIRIVPLGAARPALNDEPLFGRVVTRAFAQRRKTLRNTLKGWLSDTELKALGIDPGARAQELPVASFVVLANYLAQREGGA